MNSFANKKTQNGLINRYQTNLERRIEKGDQSLVCRDEGLCKEVEVLLCNNNAQKIHTLHGLDPLTVMEKSLHEFPSKTGQMGLEKLAKAFEVLELASLNLYVFPWRREYRLVKTFSSMFTHLIKPALTLQQAKELFALLGYQPSISNEDEELALNSKPAPSDFILALACGFFTARMECQLLLSSLGSAHRGVEWVLLLVKERQAGHSLQVALDNAKKKSEVASAADAILTSGVDTELDLYTGETDVTSAPFSPPHSSYTQPKEIKPDSDMRNNDVAGQRRSINSPGPMESFGEDQSKGSVQRPAGVNGMCSCITPDLFYIYQCEKCKHVHSPSCSHYIECLSKGHTLALCPYKGEDLYLAQDQFRLAKEKDSLKTHNCMVDSTCDTFLVCYTCQVIHDHDCNSIQKCKLNHHVLPTGKLQPPQGERVNGQKKDTCLEAPVNAMRHTSYNAHDLCQDVQNCVKYEHCVQYPQETPPAPKPFFNHCLTDKKHFPEIVCLTCKAFHLSGCFGGRHCSQEHKIQDFGTKCITCFSSELFTYCRYCGVLYCKRCCFKNVMVCKCGMPFISSSSV